MANSNSLFEVGRVVGIFRYPVKSMGAEPLMETDVSWNGLAGDRRWAFIRDGQVDNGFPWLTLRDRPDMSQYQPSFLEPNRPDKSRTVVRTPFGAVLDVTDPLLASELAAGARVIKQDRGIFDTMPLSLLTTGTVERLGAMVGAELDVQRFRPNLLVEARSGGPFCEDAWVGRVLRMGGLRIRVDKRDQRCVVINIDPATAARNAEVLRAVARERQACLGVYGGAVEPGRVAIGDSVFLESSG